MTIKLLSHSEMIAERPTRSMLVDGLLPRPGIGEIYGPTGVGKSWVVQGLGYCVGLGRPFLGRAVQQGAVVYCAAEGFHGLPPRLRTLADDAGVDLARDPDPPVYFTGEAIPFYDEHRLAELVAAITDAKLEVALIILDTLAAHQASGFDENDTPHMTAAVNGMSRLARETGALVLAVHHTGWDQSRERGNSSLRAGMDVVLSVSRKRTQLTLKVEKARDFAEPDPISLALVKSGEGLVLRALETVREDGPDQTELTPFQSRVLAALVRTKCPARFSLWLQAAGIAKSSFNDVRNALILNGLVHQTPKGLYEITEAGMEALKAGGTEVQNRYGEGTGAPVSLGTDGSRPIKAGPPDQTRRPSSNRGAA